MALGRFTPRLGQVSVKLADLNGPRGGDADQLCRLQITLIGHREVVIDERRASLRAAIDRACDRAAQAVARELHRGKAS
jgi:hypothetical protein